MKLATRYLESRVQYIYYSIAWRFALQYGKMTISNAESMYAILLFRYVNSLLS